MTYEDFEKKRNALGLTNGRISRLSGVSTATLSQWKNGAYVPKAQTLAKIIEVLDNYDPERPHLYSKHGNKVLHAEHIKPQDITAKVMPVVTYSVKLSNDTEIELTHEEYDELNDSVAIYVNAWLKSRGKID